MGWSTALDANGITYYWNESGHVQYEKPADFDASTVQDAGSSLTCGPQQETAYHRMLLTTDPDARLRLAVLVEHPLEVVAGLASPPLAYFTFSNLPHAYRFYCGEIVAVTSVAVAAVTLVAASRDAKRLERLFGEAIFWAVPISSLSPSLLALYMHNAEYPAFLFEAVVSLVLALVLQVQGLGQSEVRRRCIFFAIFGSVLPLQAVITCLPLAPAWTYMLRFMVGGFGMLLWVRNELHAGWTASGASGAINWLLNAILLPLHFVPWLMVVLSCSYLPQPDGDATLLIRWADGAASMGTVAYVPIITMVMAKVVPLISGDFGLKMKVFLVHGVLTSVLCGIYSVWWVGLTTAPFYLVTSLVFMTANGVPH